MQRQTSEVVVFWDSKQICTPTGRSTSLKKKKNLPARTAGGGTLPPSPLQNHLSNLSDHAAPLPETARLPSCRLKDPTQILYCEMRPVALAGGNDSPLWLLLILPLGQQLFTEVLPQVENGFPLMSNVCQGESTSKDFPPPPPLHPQEICNH